MFLCLRQQMKSQRFKIFFSAFLIPIIAFSFIMPAVAQQPMLLPSSGAIIQPSPVFAPVLLEGLRIHPDNILELGFIVDSGDAIKQGPSLQRESEKLIRYFLAALTVPKDQLWVNLSPYEKDRIIPDTFSKTEMGRDLLGEDYVLKQLTSSFMYPEGEIGARFWNTVRQKVYDELKTTDIPVDAFHKIWIVPKNAKVFIDDDTVFVVNSHLSVMLEEDYLALEKNRGDSHATASEKKMNEAVSDVLRRVVLPEIEREVNEGEQFAVLRQAYHSMILAVWYKQYLKETLLDRVYVDQGKVKGIDLAKQEDKEQIYHQYLKTVQEGIYNYIKEEKDPNSGEIIPREYFSGGTSAPDKVSVERDPAMLTVQERHSISVGNGRLNEFTADLIEIGPEGNPDALPSTDVAILTEAQQYVEDLMHPYWRATLKRLGDIDQLVRKYDPTFADMIKKPKSIFTGWETVDDVEVFHARVAHNDISGTPKGGIRWITAQDLMEDEEFVHRWEEFNDLNPTEADVHAFIEKWITQDAMPLSWWMSFKTALIDAGLGGGKAAVFIGKIIIESNGEGISEWKLVDPVPFKEMSNRQKAKIARTHSLSLVGAGKVGIDIDIPAPDMSTGRSLILAWYEDEYLKYMTEETDEIKKQAPELYERLHAITVNYEQSEEEYSPESTEYIQAATDYWREGHPVPWLGVYTGQGQDFGGVVGRDEATGFGVIDVIEDFFDMLPERQKLKGKTIATQASGNVGMYANLRAAQRGAIVQVMNDAGITLIKKSGWTAEEIQKFIKSKMRLYDAWQSGILPHEGAEAVLGDNEAVREAVVYADVDILVLAYKEGTLKADLAKGVRAKYIVEGANGPITPDGEENLPKGTTIIPDILANAGGVGVSGLETEQTLKGIRFTAEEVEDRRVAMLREAVLKVMLVKTEDPQLTYRQAAYRVGAEMIIRARYRQLIKQHQGKLHRIADDLKRSQGEVRQWIINVGLEPELLISWRNLRAILVQNLKKHRPENISTEELDQILTWFELMTDKRKVLVRMGTLAAAFRGENVQEEADAREYTTSAIKKHRHDFLEEWKTFLKPTIWTNASHRVSALIIYGKVVGIFQVRTAATRANGGNGKRESNGTDASALLKTGEVQPKKQKVGGIDLDPDLLDLQLERSTDGAPLPLPDQPIDYMQIEGFVPLIINVQPFSAPLWAKTDAQDEGQKILKVSRK